MKTNGVLTLTCRKCTRQQSFAGREKAMAVELAKAAGWTCEGIDFFCPKCPTKLPTNRPKQMNRRERRDTAYIAGLSVPPLTCEFCGGSVKRGDHGTDPYCLSCGFRPGDKPTVVTTGDTTCQTIPPS